MMAWIGPILAVGVQLFTLWLQIKGKGDDKDIRWLEWLKEKNRYGDQSVILGEKIDLALKWIDDHPL